MEERLQKIIAARCGISRRAAEKLIQDGKVSVNGRISVLGEKADIEFDRIVVEKAELKPQVTNKVYIMLNKPVGYVTTLSDEKGRKTVAELVKDVGVRVYPVGRLDINTDGLLLMTNDGEFANSIMHPSFEKNKTYRAYVTGDVNRGLKRMNEPIFLDGVEIKKPEVRILKSDIKGGVIEITIHEGKNRQVRRMCDIAGMRVTRLTRVAVGNLKLGNLKKGEWRNLEESDFRKLFS